MQTTARRASDNEALPISNPMQICRADEPSLVPLIDKSENLVWKDGKARGVDLLDVPLNEHGIPKRDEFLRLVIGTVARDHYWTGYFDVHHLAWPNSDYRHIHSDEEYAAGSLYRSSAILKVRLPRQLHNYIHEISVPPPIPSLEVIAQWNKEQDQIDRLYDTVKVTSFIAPGASETTKEKLRHKSYLEKLTGMHDGELGLMPNREQLSKLELDEARRVLRSLARVRGLSNARRSRKHVFREAA